MASASTVRVSVLSIQSHVVHGSVGNKAATFPMQLLGVEVDPLNVVNFSNHTGYKVFKGTRVTPEEFGALVEGLRCNNILGSHSGILSGYIGNAAVIKAVSRLVSEARNTRPDTIFMCDPVCGDNGRMYVAEEAAEAYREIVSAADVVTPNGFEASLLSRVPIASVADAVACADWFHSRGVRMVVIKSFELPEVPSTIHLLASQVCEVPCPDASAMSTQLKQRLVIRVPKRDSYFTGTGDCFSALVLAKLLMGVAFNDAVIHAVGAMQRILEITESMDVDITGRKELAIIQSRNLIVDPGFTCDASVIE